MGCSRARTSENAFNDSPFSRNMQPGKLTEVELIHHAKARSLHFGTFLCVIHSSVQ